MTCLKTQPSITAQLWQLKYKVIRVVLCLSLFSSANAFLLLVKIKELRKGLLFYKMQFTFCVQFIASRDMQGFLKNAYYLKLE